MVIAKRTPGGIVYVYGFNGRTHFNFDLKIGQQSETVVGAGNLGLMHARQLNLVQPRHEQAYANARNFLKGCRN